MLVEKILGLGAPRASVLGEDDYFVGLDYLLNFSQVRGLLFLLFPSSLFLNW